MSALGDKVFGDLWDLVVNSNFDDSTTITAANFDRDDVADLRATLNDTKKAPAQGRALICDSQHYAALVKTLNAAEIPGMTAEKQEGVVPRVSGFDVYETNIADANSENCAAFAMHRSSLLFAGRAVDATGAAEAGVEVEDFGAAVSLVVESVACVAELPAKSLTSAVMESVPSSREERSRPVTE